MHERIHDIIRESQIARFRVIKLLNKTSVYFTPDNVIASLVNTNSISFMEKYFKQHTKNPVLPLFSAYENNMSYTFTDFFKGYESIIEKHDKLKMISTPRDDLEYILPLLHSSNRFAFLIRYEHQIKQFDDLIKIVKLLPYDDGLKYINCYQHYLLHCDESIPNVIATLLAFFPESYHLAIIQKWHYFIKEEEIDSIKKYMPNASNIKLEKHHLLSIPNILPFILKLIPDDNKLFYLYAYLEELSTLNKNPKTPIFNTTIAPLASVLSDHEYFIFIRMLLNNNALSIDDMAFLIKHCQSDENFLLVDLAKPLIKDFISLHKIICTLLQEKRLNYAKEFIHLITSENADKIINLLDKPDASKLDQLLNSHYRHLPELPSRKEELVLMCKDDGGLYQHIVLGALRTRFQGTNVYIPSLNEISGCDAHLSLEKLKQSSYEYIALPFAYDYKHQIAIWVRLSDAHVEVIDSQRMGYSIDVETRLKSLLGDDITISSDRPIAFQTDKWSCAIHLIANLWRKYSGEEDNLNDLLELADFYYSLYENSLPVDTEAQKLASITSEKINQLLNKLNILTNDYFKIIKSQSYISWEKLVNDYKAIKQSKHSLPDRYGILILELAGIELIDNTTIKTELLIRFLKNSNFKNIKDKWFIDCPISTDLQLKLQEDKENSQKLLKGLLEIVLATDISLENKTSIIGQMLDWDDVYYSRMKNHFGFKDDEFLFIATYIIVDALFTNLEANHQEEERYKKEKISRDNQKIVYFYEIKCLLSATPAAPYLTDDIAHSLANHASVAFIKKFIFNIRNNPSIKIKNYRKTPGFNNFFKDCKTKNEFELIFKKLAMPHNSYKFILSILKEKNKFAFLMWYLSEISTSLKDITSIIKITKPSNQLLLLEQFKTRLKFMVKNKNQLDEMVVPILLHLSPENQINFILWFKKELTKDKIAHLLEIIQPKKYYISLHEIFDLATLNLHFKNLSYLFPIVPQERKVDFIKDNLTSQLSADILNAFLKKNAHGKLVLTLDLKKMIIKDISFFIKNVLLSFEQENQINLIKYCITEKICTTEYIKLFITNLSNKNGLKLVNLCKPMITNSSSLASLLSYLPKRFHDALLLEFFHLNNNENVHIVGSVFQQGQAIDFDFSMLSSPNWARMFTIQHLTTEDDLHHQRNENVNRWEY